MKQQKVTTFIKALTLALLFLMSIMLSSFTTSAAGNIAINATNFPDTNFRAYIASSSVDANNDGILSATEISNKTVLNVNNKNITSLKGIEYFTALKELNCYNNKITSLDLSKNIELNELDCSSNELTSLKISNNIKLEYLYCYYNSRLSSLDVSKNINLIDLDCEDTNLSSLNISNNKKLDYLCCSDNSIKTLDLTKNTELTSIECGYNKLTNINLSKNSKLKYLSISDNQLTTLELSNNPNLTNLNCNYNQLTHLDTSHNPKLTYLYCNYNRLMLTLSSKKTFDLRNLPGFDISKASNFNGATLSGTVLTLTDTETNNISYDYDCGVKTCKFYLYASHIHYGSLIKANAATCSKSGNKAYYECACGSTFEDAICSKEIKDIDKWSFIPRKKHNNENEIIKKATPNQNGFIFKKCKDCGHLESKLIYYPKTISLSAESFTYNGRTRKPTVTVTDSNGKAIAASNYKVSYPKGLKNVGSYDVSIIFNSANYEGRVRKTFIINPANTKIKTLTSGKKSFTVKWTKLSKKMKTNRISGYEIQYSTSSKFNNAKIKKVKGYSATSKKLTKLKSKKKYYMRIRSYMTVNKKNYYSPWSKTKTIKTK